MLEEEFSHSPILPPRFAEGGSLGWVRFTLSPSWDRKEVSMSFKISDIQSTSFVAPLCEGGTYFLQPIKSGQRTSGSGNEVVFVTCRVLTPSFEEVSSTNADSSTEEVIVTYTCTAASSSLWTFNELAEALGMTTDDYASIDREGDEVLDIAKFDAQIKRHIALKSVFQADISEELGRDGLRRMNPSNLSYNGMRVGTIEPDTIGDEPSDD